MNITIGEIENAVLEFFVWAHDHDFCKTVKLNKQGERYLLPLLKTYFLGRFREVDPEYEVDGGRIDFVIGSTAVEVVVRKPNAPKSILSKSVNATEIKKLLKYNKGKAVLILIDFSKSPLRESDIEGFRDWPSLGKGNHSVSAFNVIYLHLDGGEYFKSIKKNIHVNKSGHNP